MLPEDEMSKTHSKFYRPRSGLPWLILLLVLLLLPAPVAAQAQETSEAEGEPAQEAEAAPPAPPTDVIAKDIPNDKGGAVSISWGRSADDGAGANNVTGYEILRSASADGEYEHIGNTAPGTIQFSDSDTENGVPYFYRIKAISLSGMSLSLPSNPGISRVQWFDFSRLTLFLLVVIIGFAIFYFINRAKTGKELFIRKIAGLEAVDDAVGRATEMGRKIFYIPGIMDMDSMQTIAGVTILEEWPNWWPNTRPNWRCRYPGLWSWSPAGRWSRRPTSTPEGRMLTTTTWFTT